LAQEEEMSYYILFYDVVEDFVSRRAPFRDAHLRLVGEAHRRGVLVQAGALGDPPDQAALVFRAPTASVVEEFARNDPYVINRLVTRWQVRPWAAVIAEPTGATRTGGAT